MWKDCIDGGNYTVRYSELLRGIDGMGGNLTGNATMEMCRIYHGHYGAWWNDSTGAKRTATFNDWFGNTYTAPFPSHASGDSHADGAQLQGNTGWVIRGCNIGGARSSTSTTNLDPTIQADYNIVNGLDTDVGFSNSAIILNAISANPLGVLIEKNWLEGGTARLNMSIAGSDTCGGVSVLNNRFIRGSGGFYIYAQTGNTATFTSNVFDDDGTPVTITNW